MNTGISITFEGDEQPSPLGGPVPVRVVIRNLTESRVSVLMPYPNPNNMRFTRASGDIVRPKMVQEELIERTVPIIIGAASTHVMTYYLNRYFMFLKAGKATISYELTASVALGEGGGQYDATFTGRFQVELVDMPAEQLRAEMTVYAARLRDSNRQIRLEATEALAFLDTPAVVPYLLDMLKIESIESVGIHALGRHPSPESVNGIISMLAHPDSGLVAAALAELDRLKIPVQRQEIQKLLSSQNANLQWIALNWLASRPDPEDLSLLGPLLQSDNASIRDRASEYARQLQKR